MLSVHTYTPEKVSGKACFTLIVRPFVAFLPRGREREAGRRHFYTGSQNVRPTNDVRMNERCLYDYLTPHGRQPQDGQANFRNTK